MVELYSGSAKIGGQEYATTHSTVELLMKLLGDEVERVIDKRFLDRIKRLAYYADCDRDLGFESSDTIFLGYHVWRRDPNVERLFLHEVLHRDYAHAIRLLEEISREALGLAKGYEDECFRGLRRERVEVKLGGTAAIATPYYSLLERVRLETIGSSMCFTPCGYYEMLLSKGYRVRVRYSFNGRGDTINAMVVVLDSDLGVFREIKSYLGKRFRRIRFGQKIAYSCRSLRFGLRLSSGANPDNTLRELLESLVEAVLNRWQRR